MPSKFGSSLLAVERVGSVTAGRFAPGSEGGIRHRQGGSVQAGASQVFGERVSLALLGDGYAEAIGDSDIEQNARQQRRTKVGITGTVVSAPVLESKEPKHPVRTGRFGWKSQHSSLMSACADSLRNELGIRNHLYPEEYSNHSFTASPTPFDNPDQKTGKTDLERLVDEIRHTAPPARDKQLAASSGAQAGEQLFVHVGCSMCHVSTYKTLATGSLINGGTYKVPRFIGNKVIHPYSDFLLHDVGTGDGIPQAAKPEYLDQSTANKFRTAPLWGLRFRSWLMHDGKSVTYHQAIMRHGGEATQVRERYEALPPMEKQELRAFLNSL